MFIDKWMDKAAVVHKYNGILLSHKKEHIWVSSNEVDEPRAYYTEWSKLETEKQISYISAYIWNLERWYWWTYLQGSDGDADVENRFMDQGVGKENVGWMERITWKLLSCFSCVQLFATLWTVESARLCPWDFSGKNTGVGCHVLLPGIFLTQESNHVSYITCTSRQVL